MPGRVSAKSCGEVLDDLLRHEQARVARDDLAPVTLRSHRQILDHVWRPVPGRLPFLAVPYSVMVRVADSHSWNRKTYNNAISALRRAFSFGYVDYPDRIDPATRLRSAKIGKKDSVLSVTKARVDGIDKDCTKTGEDRRIQLCPRAVAILDRQLQVRARLMEERGIQHEPHLFFNG
jgi:hypothetical protein